MAPVTLTFDIPNKIISGLADGSLIRNGGVIQDASGRVVMWLREIGTKELVSSSSSLLLSAVDPIAGALNIAIQGMDVVMQGVNAGISLRGFAAVTKQLDQIQGILSVTTASSILSLGISAIGFTVISSKLKELEKRLEYAQIYLEKIDKKIDLSFYANFRAALDLAANAFTMSKGDNRRSSALSAINRFLEAEHIYTDLTDKELTESSQISDEYLLTLCLAYIAEARCYLELEEFDTAIRRFQEGREQINKRIERYLDILLTSNPSMYLHPDLKGKIDLSRLTRIYQWKNPDFTESSVFELIRDGITPKDGLPWNAQIDLWIDSLPASIVTDRPFKGMSQGSEKFNQNLPNLEDLKRGFLSIENLARGFQVNKKERRKEVIQKLTGSLEEMESMVETSQRFGAYESEVKAIRALEMSFHEWLQLSPPGSKTGKSMMYILPDEPLKLD